MSDLIISVEGLGKRYRIHHEQPVRYKTLRDTIAGGISRFIKPGHEDQKPKSGDEDFWALKDVSFDIKQGDVVGIIGRNGAGKSTLLKILSRITEPTEGRITLRGRVSSLLEVGTGFHPELTGRENIFLNGAILGMSKAEIRGKFDEIIAFAEVEKFLDTPVKHYSSGMHVRLAFAVAAFLEPEILIVDEVLAVGDAEFQKKCLGKMATVASDEGRTIVFVSHHMPSVQRLCNRAILMSGGRVKKSGETEDIIRSYVGAAISSRSSADLTSLMGVKRRGNGLAQFTKIELFGAETKSASEFKRGEKLVIRLHIQAEQAFETILFGISFIAADGTEIMGTLASDGGIEKGLPKGASAFECGIDPMILCPGRYQIRGAIFRVGEVMDHIDEMISFEVLGFSSDVSSTPLGHLVGHVYVPYRWNQIT